MHIYGDIPTTIVASSVIGLISSYLAHRRGKNPITWFFIGALFGLLGVFALFFSGTPKKRTKAPVILPPEPYLSGPANKFWYYLDEARSQVGPMSHNGITNAWKQGTVTPNTLVWHEELTEWKPLEELIRIETKN